MRQPTSIVIIGAGYGGLLAAIRLAGKTRSQSKSVSITLINATESVVERLQLHRMATNGQVRQRDIRSALKGTGVTFIRGFLTALDLTERVVEYRTERGTQRLPYDSLIYALGSTIEECSVPGVSDHAYRLVPTGPRSVETLQQRLPTLNEQGGSVVIVGAGATGVESVAEFADAFPHLHVRLITRGAFGNWTRRSVADYMRQSLVKRGIAVEDQTTVAEVRPDSVVTTDGRVIPTDLTLWTGGFTALPLARESGLAVNERGQILTDPYLRSISHPDVVAIGDAAFPVEEPGNPLRMSAFAAMVMGAHAADVLSARLRGKAAHPLSFAPFGQGIALGHHDAIAFLSYPDDQPHHPYLTGRVGYAFREFFFRLLTLFPTFERYVPGAFFWAGKGRYAAQKRQKTRPGVQTTIPTQASSR